MSEKIILVSSNPNKAIEAERILGMPLLRVSLTLPEIQAATVEEVTRYKLETARAKGYERLIVEDVSLGFDELGNFLAFFLLNASYAYWDGHASRIFTGECAGEVLVEPRGEHKFGWDPWFKPNGSTKTFAEMPPEEKDAISHRGRAYAQLREHLRSKTATR